MVKILKVYFSEQVEGCKLKKLLDIFIPMRNLTNTKYQDLVTQIRPPSTHFMYFILYTYRLTLLSQSPMELRNYLKLFTVPDKQIVALPNIKLVKSAFPRHTFAVNYKY